MGLKKKFASSFQYTKLLSPISAHFTNGETEAQQKMGPEGGHTARKQQSRDFSLDSTRTGKVILRRAEA